MLVVIAAIDPELGLVAIADHADPPLSTRRYRRLIRPRYRHVKQVESSALAVVQEVLTSLRVVKAFGQEEREHARFMTRASEGVRARLRLAFAEGAFGVLNKGIVAAGTAAVLYVGASHVRAGIISLGDLLLIVGYVAMLYDPISTIASEVTKMQSSIVSAERAFALLDQAPDVAERPGAVPLGRALGEVRCEGVSFRYRDGPLALADLSFEVPPGSRVGIVGATGAGKTTLVSLLTRFADPTDGRILLDGVDLRDCHLADLRNQFGIVLQEPVLFSTTIAENIAYGPLEATHRGHRRGGQVGQRPRLHHALPIGTTRTSASAGAPVGGRAAADLGRPCVPQGRPDPVLDEPTARSTWRPRPRSSMRSIGCSKVAPAS